MGFFGGSPTKTAATEIDLSTSTSAQSSNSAPGLEKLEKDQNGRYVIPTNINEFNFNNYYVPDPSVVKSEVQILKSESDKNPLPPNSKFWNIEYLFADVDQNVRIMVAPVPESEKLGQPIFLRETYSDLAQEYI